MVIDSRFIVGFSLFSKNSAREGSGIFASTLDPNYTFKVNNCLFSYNKATQNTLSLINAYGLIEDSIFSQNQARLYSENIFLGFSKVDIVGTKFSAEKDT